MLYGLGVAALVVALFLVFLNPNDRLKSGKELKGTFGALFKLAGIGVFLLSWVAMVAWLIFGHPFR